MLCEACYVMFVMFVMCAAEKLYGYMPPPDNQTGDWAPPMLEQRMCTVLSQLLRLPIEWIRVPLGSSIVSPLLPGLVFVPLTRS